jgi:dihydrolipoamide dehydrogenase
MTFILRWPAILVLLALVLLSFAGALAAAGVLADFQAPASRRVAKSMAKSFSAQVAAAQTGAADASWLEYDVVIIGGGAGRLQCRHPRRPAGAEGRLRRDARHPGRHLPERRLHAVQGPAARLRALRGRGKEFAGQGVPRHRGHAPLNLPQMMAEGRFVDRLTKGIEFLFKKNKVDWIKGRGRIAGAGKVEVTAADGAVKTLETRRTSSSPPARSPTGLPGVTFDEAQGRRFHRRPVAARGAEAPDRDRRRRHRAGAGLGLAPPGRRGDGGRVPRPHHAPAWTPRSPPPSSAALTKQGMKFKLGAKVTGEGHRRRRRADRRARRRRRGRDLLEADVVLVAIGRRPYTEGLGLETVGVETDKRGFVDHDHFKTSAPASGPSAT